MSFPSHIELLQRFLTHRAETVENIQGLLNAQRKPVEYVQDRSLLSRDFEDGFFALARLTHDQSRLRGQLEDAHWAGGFTPRQIAGLHNGLADPAEMMVRGFHLWRLTRWPGRNGRIRYAHTLFNLYVVRCLTLLIMRLWDAPRLAPLAQDDAGSGSASERLSQVQHLLDQLWAHTPDDQPVFVRDARWLVPMAQSPATDDLGAYFDVAKNVADIPSRDDRLAVHNAGVRMAAGHLRSQIRYYSLTQGVPLDEPSVVLTTRTSNALDFALLIQDLVPLLEAYEHACDSDAGERLGLADAICQGISPDPELFLNRVELLGAYSMIEHLFITTNADGQAVYTPMGRRHVQCLQQYNARIDRVSTCLAEDCPRFRPMAGAYSPYGALYGFSSNLLEHMALKTLQPDAVTRFSLEDVFVSGGADKLAWVSGWRQLPHLSPEVQAQFDYPQQFAEDVFARIDHALRRRTSDGEAHAAVQSGRLVIVPAGGPQAASSASLIPDLPVHYISSSDRQVVAMNTAEYRDESELLRDRREGRCVLSYRTPGGWVAITKAMLTEILGTGRDARVARLPPTAAGVLKLMCPNLVVLP